MERVLAAAELAKSLEEMEGIFASKLFGALAARYPVTINHGGWQANLLIVDEAGMHLDQDI